MYREREREGERERYSAQVGDIISFLFYFLSEQHFPCAADLYCCSSLFVHS